MIKKRGRLRGVRTPLHICVRENVASHSVTFYTSDPRIPEQTVSALKLFTIQEFDAALRMYLREVRDAARVLGLEIDNFLPNAYRAFQAVKPTPPPTISWASLWPYPTQFSISKLPEPPAEPEFEMNLTEALVGWKSWSVNGGHLETRDGFIWMPDMPAQAMCSTCKAVPTELHSCGIYATEKKSEAAGYHQILGEVSGWGRYVRGTCGWRAQFAYPRSFHLSESQASTPEVMSVLRLYHVPIYAMQPVKIYTPEEDGYEYWNDQENWNIGASEESDSEEDYDYDDD